VSRMKPTKIIVEFDNKSRVEVPFEDLPVSLQLELLRQPFASRPNPEPEKGRFVLFEWDDGWKEVIQVDHSYTDINRYYVINRVEHVGRLSLNSQKGYPELIEIVRKPFSLKKITFRDSFRLTMERSSREGHKTEHFFKLTKEGEANSEIIDILKKAVEEEGIDLQILRSREPGAIQEEYEKIRQKMDIKALSRQQDVLDFIAYLVKTMC
jgi:hypothetical protein